MPAEQPAEQALQQENDALRQRLQQLEAELQLLKHPAAASKAHDGSDGTTGPAASSPNGVPQEPSAASTSGIVAPSASDPSSQTFLCGHGLSKAQVERYSRQLLLPAFGVAAQDKLCSGSVLIVGCGGLGSPAALYLSAAGLGRIGLVDHDTVDLTNLHRQIIHSEATLGHNKALSAAAACRALNSSIAIETHTCGLNPANAVALVGSYDVVIDASDNPATRYLISDACVACGKPLVSAAAVGTDGQLTVYCHGADGPCYRCLFPVAPRPENCARCADAGVLGPVPGVLGTLQALEAIKLIAGVGQPLSRQLLLYDALQGRFMSVKLRSRVAGCVACGESPSITSVTIVGYDYAGFTGQPANDGPPQPLEVLGPEARISASQLRQRLQQQQQQQQVQGKEEQGQQVAGANQRQQQQQEGPCSTSPAAAGGAAASLLLVDVRPAEQYAIISLPGAVNIPFDSQFDQQLPQLLAAARGLQEEQVLLPSRQQERARPAPAAAEAAEPSPAAAAAAADVQQQQQVRPVVVMCRRGNHSQLAVEKLQALGLRDVVDVVGGYEAWAREVDSGMPLL